MIAIDQTPDEAVIHYQTRVGRFAARGDYTIITVPFPVLRHVEVLKPFSRTKQRAIRQLHYDASAKIFFQTRRRFWEEDDGIYGGGTVTDLAIRNLYYTDYGKETGRGILLASYTWSEDAQRWGSLLPHERIEQAIENVAMIHPQIKEEFETGASHMWHDDPYAAGRSRFLPRVSKPFCMRKSSNRKDESILPENMPRSITPGSRAHLNQACVRQLLSINLHKR